MLIFDGECGRTKAAQADLPEIQCGILFRFFVLRMAPCANRAADIERGTISKVSPPTLPTRLKIAGKIT